ncbi:hypothetical protein ELG67_09705 [Rhizobium leguminosarum]|uniref:hypothetical protein n=1 Tax=Rhizobium leguminosarum TaxID=384 RepID=UPI001037A7F4|nr:hypothetical protein [Rhizobium leguminosarum]TBG89344.1 hypothetical protein ELG67_09705 [Rhizobium leguminosarum]
MARITFDQLVPLYRNTAFDPDGDGGRLRVADASILETLKLIDIDDFAFEDAAIKIDGDAAKMEVGSTIAVEVLAPRLGLGQLARDVDGLIAAPANRVKEAARYYVIGDRYAYNDAVIPESIVRYRNALRLVKALSEAAAFVDPHQAEATFLGPSRLRVPITYKIADLGSLTSGLLDELEAFVFDKIHKDQKMAILASNVIELCRQQPEGDRFKYLVAHLRELITKTHEGYKLFASEFSYEKIKGKTEEAISEYTNKIHKTFHDIQNQVMGVPVATVIVAFQLKNAAACGVEFWGNLAVSVGASLFVVLLTMAIWNQLMTLTSINSDLMRQKEKLTKDYAAVSAQFLPLYGRLARRICIHCVILWVILIVCWAGVGMTWYIYGRVTVPVLSACLQ